MVSTEKGLHGFVILTIQNKRGEVIVHETVRADDVDVIVERTLARIN